MENANGGRYYSPSVSSQGEAAGGSTRSAMSLIKENLARVEAIMTSVYALEQRMLPILALPERNPRVDGSLRPSGEAEDLRLANLLEQMSHQLYGVQEKLNDIHRRVEL